MRRKSVIETDVKAKTVRGPGVFGSGIWHQDTLVHLAAYPHDRYERSLFVRAFAAQENAEARPAARKGGR